MRLFLSFNSRDVGIAQQIRATLLKLEPQFEIFFSPDTLRSGFWLPKLAEHIQNCDAFLLLLGPKGIGPWQAIEYLEAFDRHVQNRRFPVVPLILGAAKAPGLPFLRQLNWVEAAEAPDDKAMHRLIGALRGEAGPALAALWRIVEPYRGLEAMTEANADYFYGRDAETQSILERLASKPNRLPLLIGASGIGKSSIARAGVLSSMKTERWPDQRDLPPGVGAALRPWPMAFRNSRNTWASLVVRPGDEPLHALTGAFVRLWQLDPTDPARASKINVWAEGLRTGTHRLRDLLDATQDFLHKRDGAAPEKILIYLDQAEELYTKAPGGKGSVAERFSEELARTLPDSRLLAFGSLRADYFDRLQADRPLFDLYEQINVPPMDDKQLAEVVTRPANTLDAIFEDERLSGRIVEAAKRQPGQLPLLAYLLTDMWSAMVAKNNGCLRLPVDAIDLGGVLAARAEHFIRENPGEEAWLKRLLTLRLVVVPPEGLAIRRLARRYECKPEEWSLADRLAEHPWRLVVTRAPEDGQGEPVAELAHEALLKAWPRLETWVGQERDFLIFKADVERAEKRWHDKGDAALLMGFDLNTAEAWLQTRGGDLTEKVGSFIQKSLAADRAVKDRALQVQKQQLKFQQRVIAVFVLATILLVGIGVWANWERIRAINERSRSDNLMSSLGTLFIAEQVENAKSDNAEKIIEYEAEHGDPGAMFLLGIIHVGYIGVARDDARLATWIKKSADSHYALAEYVLGLMYAVGQGVPKDYQKALEYYIKSADDGNIDASNKVGVYYYNGRGMPQDYVKAREWFGKAAAAGNGGGMANLGWLYQNGLGVPQDYAKAREWYEKSAAAGNDEGMKNLGLFYQNGFSVPQDYAKAREWYEKAATAGNGAGMNNLGWLYQNGLGVPQDYGKAREWYEKAVAAGSGEGINQLGWLYQNGLGVPQDYAKAREWYEKAAAAGIGEGMSNLGWVYRNGFGVPQDYAKASEWYEKAATAGNGNGMNNLGSLYHDGLGVPKDYAKAREWYEKAAAVGNDSSMINLGLLYQNGWGVPQDYAKAREWYEKATAAGNGAGMNQLGWLYEKGWGVAQDHAKAREWFDKAATAGNGEGMNNLGSLYQDGLGVTRDYTKAREWYEKSAATGIAAASFNLAVLYEQGLGGPKNLAKARELYQKAADKGDADAAAALRRLNAAQRQTTSP